jgi:hypothetical protein
MRLGGELGIWKLSVSGSRAYRSKLQSILIGMIGAFFSVGGIVQACTFLAEGKLHVVAAVGFILAWVCFGVFAIARLARCRAVVTDAHLVVVNPLSTRRIAWPEIAGFALGASGIYPAVGQAILRNGRRIRIWGIQARNPLVWRRDSSAERLIQSLEADREARTARLLERGGSP